MDLVIGSLCLILLAPLMLMIALCIQVTMGRPILFRQVRPGLGGELFVLFKFRSMRIGDGDDESRLSELGAFLRRTSLDELPELWNVLKGEMSLVGPRPRLEQYLGRYSSEQKRRHDVLPGITGWAQVHGRNKVDWEQRFTMDLWYVKHRSPWLDLKIPFLTLWQVLRRKGISRPGHATMPEFMGVMNNENQSG